ncbi:UpxY family transcription antiterminator [Pedobacter sp. AW31-3R]|uniref:UpxY family transcription antiterminator n=1 Tax=Pedobacter sp. AW31-3R TaxID=3445781 RepID=UPI003F9EBCB0
MNKIYLSHSDSHEKKWLVVYTKSKCEKKVDQLFRLQGIESYCPVVKMKRKWADRYKTVELPLFNSYVFVCINPAERLKVLQTAGVINFIHYCGKPAMIPGADIDKIRLYMNQYTDIESVSLKSLKPGDVVTINDGILFDIPAEVLEVHGKSVLVVMKQLDCALVAKVKVKSDQILLAKTMRDSYAVIN